MPASLISSMTACSVAFRTSLLFNDNIRSPTFEQFFIFKSVLRIVQFGREMKEGN